MVAIPPGEPKASPKPKPIGNMPLIILLTTCTLCLVFLLWRKADSLRSVISHQLKTITRPEGQIRLSEDDGPPAHDFLEDEHIDRDDALELGEGDVRNLPERTSPDYPPDLTTGIWNDGDGEGDGQERELQDLHGHRHHEEQHETDVHQ